jgi:hypothetical protein
MAPVDTGVRFDPAIERGLLAEVIRSRDDRIINSTVSTMPRLVYDDERRRPFSPVRQPIAFPVTPLPLPNTRIIPAGGHITTVTRAVNLETVQPPETISPGATVGGELLEATQVAPAQAGAIPSAIDVALESDNPIVKYGLIALVVGVFAWSLVDTKKKGRRS